MNCPNCNHEMAPGKASLKRTWSDFLVFGFGSRELYFTGDEELNATRQLGAWDTSAAFKCKGCGVLVIAAD